MTCSGTSVGVSCGREALLFLQTRKPRLVILDFNMPDLNGLAVFGQMRKDPHLADVPVIMFSASAISRSTVAGV